MNVLLTLIKSSRLQLVQIVLVCLYVMSRSVEFLYVKFKYSLQQDDGRYVVDGETVRGSQVRSSVLLVHSDYAKTL